MEFIVKVQLALTAESVLVYNQDQSIYYEQDGIPSDILKIMKGRKKVYFWATIKNRLLHIDREAPEQEW